MRFSRMAVLGFVVAAACLSACSKHKAPAPEPFSDQLKAPGQIGAPGDISASGRSSQALGDDQEGMRPTSAGVSAKDVLRTIYFDYDRSELRPDQRPVLDQNYQWLGAHPEQRVIIEGHCDERGTVEYNFALGDRRASEVRKYLMTRGVDPKRLVTISKGEEEPVAAGHTEAAWAQNRRAEFKFLQ